jgi:hypothetical protein
MSKAPSKGGVPTPPPRDLVREARRLARLQRLRVVTDESQGNRAVQATRDLDPDPKEAA